MLVSMANDGIMTEFGLLTHRQHIDRADQRQKESS